MKQPAVTMGEGVSEVQPVGQVLALGWQPGQTFQHQGIILYLDGIVAIDESVTAVRDGVTVDFGQRLVSLYRQYGAGVLDRLRGSFAIAFWDPNRRRLLMAVDPFGIRKLFYSSAGNSFAFAQRLSCFLSWDRFQADVDPNVLFFYLNHSFVPAPFTIYRGIQRLEPGQLLEWDRGGIRVREYWEMTYPEERSLDEQTASENVRAAVENSVRHYLATAKGRFASHGAFLSGGTDSSTIVGLLSRITPEAVKTFSVGFGETVYNEIQYARIAAAKFRADGHEYFVTADEALEAIPLLADAFDEPFGNSSAIPTYFCLRMARNAGVDMMFAGDGGDELFAGNERYASEKVFTLYHKLPTTIRSATDFLANVLPPVFPLTKFHNYVRKANQPVADRFWSYQLYFRDHATEYFSNDFLELLDMEFPIRIPRQHYARAGEIDPLNRLLYVDLKLAIADNDLFKVNRTAEMLGIDVVYPYLDKDVASVSGMVAAGLKLRGWKKRYIFKKAFETLLPKEILSKKKHGFGLPTGDWLRTHPGFRELARSLLLDQRSIDRGYFRRNALESLLVRHDNDTSSYYGSQIWNVMMFELWHRCHLDGK